MPKKRGKKKASHSKSIYKRHRQQQPDQFKQDSFRTVPLHHTKYRGKKFAKWNKKDSGAKAIVGRKKATGKSSIQSILIPKKEK